MHILLTNDDGIYAEGIYVLYEQLKKLGIHIKDTKDGTRWELG